MEFLQKLRTRYGDISLTGILNRCKNIFGTNKVETPQKILIPSPPQSQKINSLDAVANYGISTPKKPRFAGVSNQTINSSPFAVNSKFSPINIASMKDWAELRAVVLDLHDLRNFFAGKQDSQSPQFMNLIETYQNKAEKKLATPPDFDENTSSLFVEKLASVIKKRFHVILKACAPGLQGKGSEPISYYQNISVRVKKYFASIGLKCADVKQKENYRQWMEHMEAISTIPTPFEHWDNLISEIIVQPYFFEYYNEDGEIEKFWIDGECTVFKK